MQLWTNSIAKALQQISTLPLNQIIRLLAVWALLAYLLSQAQTLYQEPSGVSRGRRWFEQIYARLDSAVMQNILFFLLLALGSYISMAAIAANPGLQEKSTASKEVSSEQLQLQLEGCSTV